SIPVERGTGKFRDIHTEGPATLTFLSFSGGRVLVRGLLFFLFAAQVAGVDGHSGLDLLLGRQLKGRVYLLFRLLAV
uniref:Uncharacterized protein n=1 Tax=Oncorhynchus mykiss TaxID=8022 RepID=A0A8C7QVY2_ONCMY